MDHPFNTFINAYAHARVESMIADKKAPAAPDATYAEVKAAAEQLYPANPGELTDLIVRYLRSKGAL